MTPSTVVTFELRCTNCYQVMHASMEESGKAISCLWCRKSFIAPEATPERIERAANSGVASTALLVEGMFTEAEPMAYADQRRLARQRAKRQPSCGNKICRNPSRMSASRFCRLLAILVDGAFIIVAGLLGVIPVIALLFFDVLGQESMSALASFLEKLMIAARTDSWTQLSVPKAAWAPLAATNSVLLLFLAFQWRMIATRGQSLGKSLLGIKIVNGSGQPPGFFCGVLVRNGFPWLLSVIPIFVFSGIPAMLVVVLSWANILLICLEPPRCLHDRIAGTFVVDA